MKTYTIELTSKEIMLIQQALDCFRDEQVDTIEASETQMETGAQANEDLNNWVEHAQAKLKAINNLQADLQKVCPLE